MHCCWQTKLCNDRCANTNRLRVSFFLAKPRAKERVVFIWAPSAQLWVTWTLSSQKHVSKVQWKLTTSLIEVGCLECYLFCSSSRCVCYVFICTRCMSQRGRDSSTPRTTSVQYKTSSPLRRRTAKTRPTPVRPTTNRRIVMWACLLRSLVTPIVPIQRPYTAFTCAREEFICTTPCLREYFLTHLSYHVHYCFSITFH